MFKSQKLVRNLIMRKLLIFKGVHNQDQAEAIGILKHLQLQQKK